MSALLLTARVAFVYAILLPAHAADAPAVPQIDGDGTVQVPAFDLPLSSYLSPESRAAWPQWWRDTYGPSAQVKGNCTPMSQWPTSEGEARAKMPAIRQCYVDEYYKSAGYKRLHEQHRVAMTIETIGGVYSEVFTPIDGIAPKNARRVLVQLHGGGFLLGARITHGGAMPIAALAKIKVISIDYRMAPEYVFPAASEDVAAVYRELLKTYPAKNIGLYGCSAGAWLSAQAVAWFQKENLPTPGAIGMFCAGAPKVVGPIGRLKYDGIGSDSMAFFDAIQGGGPPKDRTLPVYYWRAVERTNSLAYPGDADEVMAKFPPSLLISGTRDFLMSEVLVTHAQLVRLGVPAQLHVWEGMDHAFMFNPAFREAGEANDVVIKFFDAHLGR